MYATQFCRLQWVFLTNYNPGCALNKEETQANKAYNGNYNPSNLFARARLV